MRLVNPRFLLTAEDLQQEFAALLNKADSVKIAVAWATLGIQIDMLKNARIPTEMVVGKAFNLTHPDAIESMRGLGKVYVDERTDKQGLFHPKFYLFKMGDQCTVIIGSANLTAGAFTLNSEASLRVSLDQISSKPLLQHFEELRKDATPVTSTWLRRYRTQYKPPKRGIGKRLIKSQSPRVNRRSMSATAVGRLLTYSWGDYYTLLQRLAVRRNGKSNLFDPEESYLKTLEVVRPIIKKRFDQLKSEEFRYLIGGKETCPNTGYFGSLTGAVGGVPALMRDRRLRRDITRLLPKVQKARSRESALAAGRRFFLRLVRTKGIKNAVATRFLSLARPDLFISVNKESVKRLSRILGVTPSRIKDWDGYELAVRKLWQSRWYQSKRPTRSTEAEVWAARAALVDIYASEYKW